MIKKHLISSLYTFSSVFVVLALTWTVLFKCNFFYGFWHDYGGIKETIEYFAPKNQHISDFENTTAAERNRVFQQISHAVHFNKNDLANITFSTPKGIIKPMLHQREIIHLQDVATLISILMVITTLMTMIWGYLLWQFKQKSQPLPSLKKQCLQLLLSIFLLLVLTLTIGATKVFYWLHELIFPSGHQWFFYYQDSLMSTLMSAPDLFGWIALEWLVLFVISFCLLQWATAKIYTTKNNTL